MKYLLREDRFFANTYVNDGVSVWGDWKVWTFSKHPGNKTITKLKEQAKQEKRNFYLARGPGDIERNCWWETQLTTLVRDAPGLSYAEINPEPDEADYYEHGDDWGVKYEAAWKVYKDEEPGMLKKFYWTDGALHWIAMEGGTEDDEL